MQGGKTARTAAARLIEGVTEGHVMLADQIAAGALEALAPQDRARAQRLALATLRRLGPADRVLKPHLRRRPPPPVLALLRLATVEVLGEGGDPHGVVHDVVGALRDGGARLQGYSGLANAVLRKVVALPAGALVDQPAQELPGWLRGRLMSAWGKGATLAMEAAHAAGAALDLTPRDGDAAALAARLGGISLPTGSVRLQGRTQVSELPGYADGDWWVQDAAAAVPARALAPTPGLRVLDLCAAPGGKTLQLAAAGADVTALDISAPRMERLQANLKRCSLSAQCIVADALAWTPQAPFDAVLLDAPCSATGTIRRHPDLPFVRDPAGLKPVLALQAALIDRALSFLRPGGRLVYATCSLLPDEGEGQMAAALARHPDLTLAPTDLPGSDPAWASPAGGLRTRPDFWPDLGGLDGFFVARLQRAA